MLAPLARVKAQIQGFIRTANTTSAASASRAAAEQASIRLFPTFLAQLRPLMVQLQGFANQGTPVMASLAQSASALDRQFQNLAPFARAARPALISLGHYSQLSTPQLLGTEGLDARLLRVGRESVAPANLLDRLLSSFDQTGGFEQLMSLLYYGTSASNGFDKLGHYLRSEPQTQGCPYSITPIGNCLATFGTASSARPPRWRASPGLPSPGPPTPRPRRRPVRRLRSEVPSRRSARCRQSAERGRVRRRTTRCPACCTS